MIKMNFYLYLCIDFSLCLYFEALERDHFLRLIYVFQIEFKPLSSIEVNLFILISKMIIL